MRDTQQSADLSTFRMRRRTPGSFLLVPCPRQGNPLPRPTGGRCRRHPDRMSSGGSHPRATLAHVVRVARLGRACRDPASQRASRLAPAMAERCRLQLHHPRFPCGNDQRQQAPSESQALASSCSSACTAEAGRTQTMCSRTRVDLSSGHGERSRAMRFLHGTTPLSEGSLPQNQQPSTSDAVTSADVPAAESAAPTEEVLPEESSAETKPPASPGLPIAPAELDISDWEIAGPDLG